MECNARTLFESDPVTVGLFDFLCGDFLGRGASREVYESNAHPGCVIKIEIDNWFQNVCEWQVWERIKDTDQAKWFAPCVSISACGRILVQKRTKEAPFERFPEKIPAYFTDEKEDNWGLYKGRMVCHDYGVHLLLERGMTARMKKAVWW